MFVKTPTDYPDVYARVASIMSYVNSDKEKAANSMIVLSAEGIAQSVYNLLTFLCPFLITSSETVLNRVHTATAYWSLSDSGLPMVELICFHRSEAIS